MLLNINLKIFTFDKYCYVNVRLLPEFFNYKNEIIYSKIDKYEKNIFLSSADGIHLPIRRTIGTSATTRTARVIRIGICLGKNDIYQ